jgi:hypothetical protein
VAAVPAGLEAVGDAGDHDRGDVAVEAADAGEAVAEAAGLGDLGDVVLDEPGFVGVAGVVEVHAVEDGPGAGGAVGGGSPDAAGPGDAPGVGGPPMDLSGHTAIPAAANTVSRQRETVSTVKEP